MSRIGKMPIKLPDLVNASVEGSVVKIKGPKGELSIRKRPEIKVEVNDNEVVVTEDIKTNKSNAYWGMTRAILASMVEGVTEGYSKKLQLVGVGYRAAASGKGVALSVGFSKPVQFDAPEGVKIEVVDSQNITISGVDKQLVGQTAAKIRAVRKPEPYKGKGIMYEGESIRRKAGKSGKV